MSIDWSAVRPSTSPALTWAEVLALPEGMVLIEIAKVKGIASPIPILLRDGRPGERQIAEWQGTHGALPASWSTFFTYEESALGEFEVRLPRLPRMSFALTTEAVRKRQKTVTRRLERPSWWKEGALFLGVDKIRQAGAQGLCIAQCGKPTQETLAFLDQSEVDKEGFPGTTPEGFRAMFRAANPKWGGWLVWRLPFSYLEIPS